MPAAGYSLLIMDSLYPTLIHCLISYHSYSQILSDELHLGYMGGPLWE